MKMRILGTNLQVSSVGLGCMGMSHAYGEQSTKEEAQKLIETAIENGCTFFDTAEVYGEPDNPHHNEEMLGEILKPYRNQITIATKFGVKFDLSAPTVNKPVIPDSRPAQIRKSVEGSLKRLQTDHIDLYYQHRQDPEIPVEEVAGVISELIQEGKITHWGLSEVNEETIRKAHAICPVTAIQNRYHMMYRNYEVLFPVLEELKIGFVAFSPLANGLLSGAYNAESSFRTKGDYRQEMPQFQADAYEKNQKLFNLIQTYAEQKNATPAQISLAWILCKKPYLVPIPGTRKLNRLTENLGSADVELTAEEVTAIDKALETMEMSKVFGGAKIIQK